MGESGRETAVSWRIGGVLTLGFLPYDDGLVKATRVKKSAEVSMRTVVVGALCAIAMVANANAAIREEPVSYTDGETTMKGFVVYDDAIEANRPGIVMVHEWWGITKHIHSEARKFAQQGYTTFMADMLRE